MKVLQVINGLNIGGAEVLLTNYLLSTKNSEDIQNDLCILYDSKTFLYKKLEENNIKIYNLKSKNKYDIRIVFKLIKLIKQNKYDIVHVHLFPAQYFCSLASLFTKDTKFIFTEHNSFNRRRNYAIFRIFDYFSYLPYTKIVCVSNMAKNDLINWIPSLSNKVLTIYNGIPLEDKKEDNIKYDLILVGSMRSNVKGIDILLKSIKSIEGHINKVAIVGDGILKDELINLRNNLGLEDKVDFLGNRNDINNLLEQSKIFILPSRWEGLPVSILEAMSKAKPIIATKVGGIPEILEDGKTGLLVEPENEIDLAKAIKELLNNYDYAKKLGETGYNVVKNKFSIEKYSDNLYKLYNDLIN
jgi:glycosyltransferase involved in cell wall biosynthesis